jgi:Tol biopolymer transport system component
VKQVSKNTADDFTSPAWTADGKYIVASKMPFGIGANELWMYHVDGGTGVQITKSKPTPTTPRKERHNAMGVVASPDGKYLYYAVRQGPFTYNAQLPLWKIVRRDRKTGDEDEIISQPESAFRPTLSPDGKQLAYVTRYETESGLRLRNLETGEDRWVKYPVTRDEQESLFTRDVFPEFAFLPSGKEIVYNQDGKIRRLDLASGSEKNNSVHGAGFAGHRAEAGFSAESGARSGESAIDHGSDGVAGQQEAGVFGDDAPLLHGIAAWPTAAFNQREWA